MLLKDYAALTTLGLKGLNDQIIWTMLQLKPACLVRVRHPKLLLSQEVLPYMQVGAATALSKFLDSYKGKLQVTAIFRPLPAQLVLWNLYLAGDPDIPIAAEPGHSNHGSGLCLDTPNAEDIIDAIAPFGFVRSVPGDPPHFEYQGDDAQDLRGLMIQSYQHLSNLAKNGELLSEDGVAGDQTIASLNNAPCEGFPDVGYPRIMTLTDPLQQGHDVGQLQERLKANYLSLKSADCVFGTDTKIAVKLYQVLKGLSPDGIAGVETQKSLGLMPEHLTEI